MNALITVILPTYNGARFLAEAVASIHANRYAPLEILVMDDGSTDTTVHVARELVGAANVVSHVHCGRPAVGRNAGIAHARGEWIAFLDQDDLWAADKLVRQLARFTTEPELQAVWGHSQRVRSSAVGIESFGEPVDYRLVSSALFRKRVFERVGGFDASLRYLGDDTDWFLRAREAKIPMEMVEAVTLYWRIHDANTSHTLDIRNHAQGYDHALTELVKKELARRRSKNLDSP